MTDKATEPPTLPSTKNRRVIILVSLLALILYVPHAFFEILKIGMDPNWELRSNSNIIGYASFGLLILPAIGFLIGLRRSTLTGLQVVCAIFLYQSFSNGRRIFTTLNSDKPISVTGTVMRYTMQMPSRAVLDVTRNSDYDLELSVEDYFHIGVQVVAPEIPDTKGFAAEIRRQIGASASESTFSQDTNVVVSDVTWNRFFARNQPTGTKLVAYQIYGSTNFCVMISGTLFDGYELEYLPKVITLMESFKFPEILKRVTDK